MCDETELNGSCATGSVAQTMFVAGFAVAPVRRTLGPLLAIPSDTGFGGQSSRSGRGVHERLESRRLLIEVALL
jgi:hypothetical protein